MITLVLLLNPPKPPKSNTKTSYTSKRIITLKKSLPPANPTHLPTAILKTSPLIPNSSASRPGREIIIYLSRTPASISFLKDTTVTPSRSIKPLITIIKRKLRYTNIFFHRPSLPVLYYKLASVVPVEYRKILL